MDPRSILAFPAMYRLFGHVVGAHQSRIRCVEQHIRPSPGDQVLDCGCGPGDFLDYLSDVEYVGIDIDEDYIRAARSRFGDRATFRLGPVDAETMREKEHYDLVLAWGLLHHLEDDQVLAFLHLARASLKPSGRLVTLDGCYTKDQSAAARWLLNMDRGGHVRSLDAWLDLVRPVFPAVQAHVREDLLRIPYTQVIMECPVDPQVGAMDLRPSARQVAMDESGQSLLP